MTADGQHQFRQSFTKQDMQDNHNDFEQRYGKYPTLPFSLRVIWCATILTCIILWNPGDKSKRVLGHNDMRPSEHEEVDEYGRVTRGPYTMKNGATYTG